MSEPVDLADALEQRNSESHISPDCQPRDVWIHLCAGQDSGLDAQHLLDHAALCQNCGANLREASKLFAGEATVEEVAQLAELVTSSESGRRRVAHELLGQLKRNSVSEAKASSVRKWRIWSSLVLAAATVCIVTVYVFRTFGPRSDAQLLAAAYNKQRTLVLRIPGGNPGPLVTGERGPNDRKREASELLELRLRAQQHLDRTPNSPYWHQILGEIELQEQNGFAARRDLEIAQIYENLPNLPSDLAAAWFEIGDEKGDALAYAEAAELYGIQIQKGIGGKALLYYNRAQCWERMNLTDKDFAIQDLNAAIAEEHSPAWRQAIREEIARLSTHSELQPGDGFENALANATAKLLPQWEGSAEARASLAKTAALGLVHHDRWLQDWMATPHTAESLQADSYLSAAADHAITGEAETSALEARNALRLYSRINNIPGVLRSTNALAYAQQRLGRSAECIATAHSIVANPLAFAYTHLFVHSMLTEAMCQLRNGKQEAAQREIAVVMRISDFSKLPQMHLYAMSVQEATLQMNGRNSESWNLGTAALKACKEVQCTPTRRYSLLYYLVRNAQDVGLPYTAMFLMRSAIPFAATSGDKVTHAYALETLGSVAGTIGDYDASAQAFKEASGIAHSGNQAALAALYQAEWKTDQAEVLSREGQPLAALDSLQQSAPAILASDYSQGRIKYFRHKSIADLALGRKNEALMNALSAVEVSEQLIPRVEDVDLREQWVRENAGTYAQLVNVYLQRGDTTAALNAWEKYRSAPYAHARDAPHSNEAGQGHVIILARVDKTYVGWVAETRPLKAIQTIVLGNQPELKRLTETFYRLCSDPDSRLSDIHHVGAQIFATLLAPLLHDITSQTQPIWIDLDPSLSMLPLAALTTPDGEWLADTKQFAILPPWWSVHPAFALTLPTITDRAHLIVLNGFDETHGKVSEATELRTFFAHIQIINGGETNPTLVLHELANADMFHFAGHSSAAQLILGEEGRNLRNILAPEDFEGFHFAHCSIAVIAACNTNSVDIDNAENQPVLRNAMLHAGAHVVVASNWDVDDSSTQLLMLSFYRRLASGNSFAQALQFAQKMVRARNEWRHPYFWSSFESYTN